MENVCCDLCGSQMAELAYRVRDTNYGTPGEFLLVRCRQCGLVYLNPRPSVDELARAYPLTSYDPYQAVHSTQQARPSDTELERCRMLTHRRPPGRVLDVGSGAGTFLLALRDAGWKCVGVEFNPEVVARVRERWQLEVQAGDIFIITESGTFDLITLWDVLEHTPSPKAVLAHAEKLLKPDGALALNLPNWDSFERRFFQERWIALDAPRHLYHFTPATLTRLLDQCGFEIDSLRAQAPVLSLASNSLRLIGDMLLRQGRSKALTAPAVSSSSNTSLSPKRRRLIRLVHVLMTPLNEAANVLQHGSSITVVARKASTL